MKKGSSRNGNKERTKKVVNLAQSGTGKKGSGFSSEVRSSATAAAALESVPLKPEHLSDPVFYLNRELTWLEWNERVLAQAMDKRVPLLERVRFAAIAGSNLDEFFMKRIGGLKQQVGAGVLDRTVDGRTPVEQIVACYGFIRKHQQRKQNALLNLKKLLKAEGIDILAYQGLTEEEKKAIRESYVANIYPLVTPQSIEPAHPFPFISNLSLNLLVTLRYKGEREISLARVKVPVSAGAHRFIQVGTANRFVLLEDVMAENLDLLFPRMEIVRHELFRVTRNSNTDRHQEHADDLLALIESALQDRKFAPIVRLEVRPGMDTTHRGRLASELGLNEEADVFEVGGMMGMRDLFELADLNVPHLRYAAHHPVDHPALQSERNIFHTIRDAGSILIQHPYEAFSSSVERLIREAAGDPKVRGIKMILYRTSEHSRVIDYLIRAAQNGKQVAVVVELQARFDEAANIRLASKLEEVGIHVTYGVIGLKTHAKVILIVRQDYNGLRRYVHVGTGNYHSLTSRLYSDLGLLTCDPVIGEDATELFNYLTTGYTPKRNYRKLIPAPKILKSELLSRIEREIKGHGTQNPGLIQFKMNALEDSDVTRALYEAGMAGVQVDLLVRDSCRLRPGVPGLSDKIRVVSILGRFLEHSRIYYFRNGGQEEYFIGSADAMKRNLEHRVEVLVPVEDPQSRTDLREILDTQLKDGSCAWEMQSDGTYRHRERGDGVTGRCSQEVLIELAEKRHRDVTRLKKRRSKHFGQRNIR
ncbi:MAG: polyphosphate kinase 1 [bacterium]|nr:polyphosphate kinase 1 [bacterium]